MEIRMRALAAAMLVSARAAGGRRRADDAAARSRGGQRAVREARHPRRERHRRRGRHRPRPDRHRRSSDNRITEVRSAGTPGVPLEPNRPTARRRHTRSTRPDVGHARARRRARARRAGRNAARPYAYKLWLAHGVTTVRGVSLTGNAAAVRDKARERDATRSSRRGSTTTSGRAAAWPNGTIDTPQKAPRVGRAGRRCNGIDGVKFAGTGVDQDTAILAAMIDEAKKRGLGTTMHHSPPVVSRGQRGRDRRAWASAR